MNKEYLELDSIMEILNKGRPPRIPGPSAIKFPRGEYLPPRPRFIVFFFYHAK
jgi:hypothetical protein